MISGTRILERMTAVGLSQAELARRVGLAQPTIFNLIHRGKKGSTKLHLIARELETTPAYLTGETDDPSADEAGAPALDAETRQLVNCFGRISQSDRRAVLQLVRSLAQSAPSDFNIYDHQTGTASVIEAKESRGRPLLTDTHIDARGGTLHDKDSKYRGE